MINLTVFWLTPIYIVTVSEYSTPILYSKYVTLLHAFPTLDSIESHLGAGSCQPCPKHCFPVCHFKSFLILYTAFGRWWIQKWIINPLPENDFQIPKWRQGRELPWWTNRMLCYRPLRWPLLIVATKQTAGRWSTQTQITTIDLL